MIDIDTDALRGKIEEVLSDILSRKYGCKVTLRFVSEGGGKSAGRKANQTDRALCVNGA